MVVSRRLITPEVALLDIAEGDVRRGFAPGQAWR
jgi:hypothetical protein